MFECGVCGAKLTEEQARPHIEAHMRDLHKQQACDPIICPICYEERRVKSRAKKGQRT